MSHYLQRIPKLTMNKVIALSSFVVDNSQPLLVIFVGLTSLESGPSYDNRSVNEAVPKNIPDSKVHGANMRPTWVLPAPDWPHVGSMNLAIRDVLHGSLTHGGAVTPYGDIDLDQHGLCKSVHHLNICCIINNEVQRQSPEVNFTRYTSAYNWWHYFSKTSFKSHRDHRAKNGLPNRPDTTSIGPIPSQF